MRAVIRRGICLALLIFSAASPAAAYSVLAHESLIDAAWDSQIAPTLRRRFPTASPSAVRDARAYAYGGSLIHDLGFYPLFSHPLSRCRWAAIPSRER